MSKIDVKKIKTLRDETGASFSLIKRSLEEAKGNLDKAKKILSTLNIKRANDKSGEAPNEGAIFCYVHHNRKVGALITLFCQTDFVAKNKDFTALGESLAMQIAFSNPPDEKNLLASNFIRDESKTIEVLLKEQIALLGENIKIGSFIRYQV